MISRSDKVLQKNCFNINHITHSWDRNRMTVTLWSTMDSIIETHPNAPSLPESPFSSFMWNFQTLASNSYQSLFNWTNDGVSCSSMPLACMCAGKLHLFSKTKWKFLQNKASLPTPLPYLQCSYITTQKKMFDKYSNVSVKIVNRIGPKERSRTN